MIVVGARNDPVKIPKQSHPKEVWKHARYKTKNEDPPLFNLNQVRTGFGVWIQCCQEVQWDTNRRRISVTHICDNLVCLRWWRRRRRWWRWGQKLRVNTIQVLDASLVIFAQSQWVGERVVGWHYGSWLARVLQAKDVPELMGSDLEEVCACKVGDVAKPQMIQKLPRANCIDLVTADKDSK